MSEKSIAASKPASNFKTIDIVYIGIFAALIAVCSWISIVNPLNPEVPFTLQTFAIFLSVCLLGGKRGTFAVLVYILLGVVGLPVFAGFHGGIGILLGNTGGYIIGFLFSALIMWLFEKLLGKKIWVYAISMVCGLIVCYAFGTVWFLLVYTRKVEAVSLMTVLGWCVIPYIIPDLAKITLALLIGRNKGIRRITRLENQS